MISEMRIRASVNLTEKRFEFSPLYSGGTLWVNGFDHAVVLDIEGLESLPNQARAHFDHDEYSIAGTFRPRIVTKDGKPQIFGDGHFENTPSALRILEAFKEKNLRWECSIGTKNFSRFRDMEFLPAGKTAEVNRRKFVGPLGIVRRWALDEGSFVRRGGDARNTAVIHARAIEKENLSMSEELKIFITESGYDPESLTPDQMCIFEKAFVRHCAIMDETAAQADELDPDADPAEVTEEEIPPETPPDELDADDADPDGDAVSDAEVPADAEEETAEKDPDEVTARKVRAKKLKARKVRASAVLSSRKVNPRARRMGYGRVTASCGAPDPMDVYSVAMMRNTGLFTDAQVRASGFSDDAMTEGLSRQFNGFTVKEMAIEMLRHSTGKVYRGNEDAFVDAFFYPEKVKASAFSTQNPLGILENVLNKAYYQGSQRVSSIVDKIARRFDVSNLHDAKITSYSVYGLPFDQAEDGPLKNATLVPEDYEIGISRSGNVLTLTRDMLLKNEIEGFVDAVIQLGTKHKRKREKRGIQKLLSAVGAASTVFNAAHGNAITPVLGLDGLAAAAAALMSMPVLGSDPNDAEASELEGKYLLVPPQLASTASTLFTATNLAVQTPGNTIALTNTYLQYEPLVSPYLASLYGGSNTCWFLLADPAEAAILGETRLRGAADPHITPVPTAGNIIGKSWATFFEYGFGLMDHRAAVYSTGAGN